MKGTSRKKRALKMPAKLPKRTSQQMRIKAAQKPRRAKQTTTLQRLGGQRTRFVIWAGKSSNEQLSERLRRFLPERELFWETALKVGVTRQEYEARLLNQSKIRSRILAINRGARLVLSAAGWKKPTIGERNSSAIARGVQWQTTMAWTGLELLCDSLFPRINNCEADNVREWCQLLGLDELDEEIKVPNGLKRSAIIRNLWQEEVEILEFLDVRGGKPRRALDTWWVKQTPIADYVTALQAARAIRDVTSHGLLSAHRVGKFGLVSANRNGVAAPLNRLIDVIAIVALETLKKLLAK